MKLLGMINTETKRILIKGVTGFIGSHITKQLLREGTEVYSLIILEFNEDNPMTKDIMHNVNVVRADLANINEWENVRVGIEPEIIFHLAAYTNVGRSLKHAREDTCIALFDFQVRERDILPDAFYRTCKVQL